MSEKDSRVTKIENSVSFLKEKVSASPQIGIILGSGLGAFAEELENPTVIEYKDIPDFPVSTVEGHAGKLVFGQCGGKDVVVMAGRFHFYEGYDMDKVVFPVRVMASMGIQQIIVTNAAGGINKSFVPGDLMIISDHINLTGQNPLRGKNIEDWGVRFPDMSTAYTPKLQKLCSEAASKCDLKLQKGVYIAVTGPSFETPAEIKMMRVMGADAVGMSTVPEVITARHMGLEILGISCITNMAAGILDQPLTHTETYETANQVKEQFIQLLKQVVSDI